MPKLPVSAALFLAFQSTGSSSAALGDPGQRALAQSYVAALRSQDAGRLRLFIHSATLACTNAANRPYFDAYLATQLAAGARFGPTYSIKQIVPVARQFLAAMESEGFVFPVQPALRMQIDSDLPNRSIAVQIYLARDRGAWRSVQPCATPIGMKVFFGRNGGARSRR